MIVTILEGVTAANSAPSLATDGVPLWKGMLASGQLHPGEGLPEDVDEVELVLRHTAYVSGVPALASARWWGGYRIGSSLVWGPPGQGTGNAGASTDKGRLNAGATIEGASATTFFHSERLRGLREMERIALQVGAFTGIWTLQAVLIARGRVRP